MTDFHTRKRNYFPWLWRDK